MENAKQPATTNVIDKPYQLLASIVVVSVVLDIMYQFLFVFVCCTRFPMLAEPIAWPTSIAIAGNWNDLVRGRNSAMATCRA